MKERKQQDLEKKKQAEDAFITRRTFYLCVFVLLAVIFLQGMWIRRSIQTAEDRLRNQTANQIELLRQRVEDIPIGIEQALLESENPCRESSIEIIPVDGKQRTARLRTQAKLKEYEKGTAVYFLISCDGAEALEVPATVGKDRSFRAEVEIPFCGEAAVTVRVERNGIEYIQELDHVNVAGEVQPAFSGNWSGSSSWSPRESFMTFAGELFVDISLPDWLAEQESYDLKQEQMEVLIDGKQVKTFAAKQETEDPNYRSYVVSVREADQIRLEKGKTLEFVFCAEDTNGLRYRYVVERGYLDATDGYISEESGIPASGGDPKLTITE